MVQYMDEGCLATMLIELVCNACRRESTIRHITSALLKDQYRDKLVLHVHCNLDGSEAE